jgi:hypothetical protein
MKIAGSEGARHMLTRLSRLLDANYHELRNENDRLRQDLAEHKEQIKKLWRAIKAGPQT